MLQKFQEGAFKGLVQSVGFGKEHSSGLALVLLHVQERRLLPAALGLGFANVTCHAIRRLFRKHKRTSNRPKC